MEQKGKVQSILLLLAAEVMASSSVIFIRLSTIHPLQLSAYRMLLSVIILFPFYLKETHKPEAKSRPFAWKDVRKALIPGVLLGIHFISWISGARLIPAANASLIVNLTPIISPLVLFIMVREKVSRGEMLGSLVALAGISYLALGDFSAQKEYFRGDLITLGSMLAFAVYQTIAKKHMVGLWRYLLPLYLVGGLFCLMVAAISSDLSAPWTRNDLLAVVGLAVICTIGGHSIFNLSMRNLRGQVVSVFHTSQFIYAGVMGYFILHETPSRKLLVAGPLLVSGVIITIMSQKKKKSTVTDIID